MMRGISWAKSASPMKVSLRMFMGAGFGEAGAVDAFVGFVEADARELEEGVLKAVDVHLHEIEPKPIEAAKAHHARQP